jgi:hypothetical protein
MTERNAAGNSAVQKYVVGQTNGERECRTRREIGILNHMTDEVK